MTRVRVGMFAPIGPLASGSDQRRAALDRIADAGVDHVCVGDHISFFVGAGADGLINATSLLTHYAELPCYVALYLLPLRHPLPVARQLASIAELAPGRLTLGVGIGGEDRHELEICGVDPSTRGRRMDECLRILRALSTGDPTTFDGEFFSLQDALIVPSPSPPIPVIVGGRSDAAVRRAGQLGDGWLGIWVSPRRFAAVVGQIAHEAGEVGRDPAGFRARHQRLVRLWPHPRRRPRAARGGNAELLPHALRSLRALLPVRDPGGRCRVPPSLRRSRLLGVQRDRARR
jgi:alkanesulfonate monooxygenase SsuD/methylene tetrahydromethanopterin reductase-like flavin-dependent oxidoreductase (luciferase family)